jgi:RHS repeat-associated protein
MLAASPVTHTYDRLNRMTGTANAAASRVFSYDANGNALADTLTVDGQTVSASYTFDALDNPSYTHYSLSGRSVFLAPDALGRPTQASGFASGITYFPSGQIYSIAHTNVVGSYYGQNARLWPASHVVLRGSTALVNNAYTYDNTGNVTSVIDYAGQSYGRVFGYDALERLTTANGPWGSGAITYDARGNITGQSLGSFNTGMAYNATTGQLQSAYIAKDGIASTSYPTYNYAGHMTFDGKNQFFFTVLDQLTCANCHTLGRETRYGYDGLGMRVWSQKGNPSNPSAPLAKTYEFHSRDNRLLMEWQASAGGLPGFTKEHIYAGQRRIAEVHTITGQAAKITHAHPDPSGSPAMLSDVSGLVSAREHYRPYGDKLFSPTTNESAGFANKAFDASTNLSYMSARYYNPTLGRFISPDPVHFIEGNIHSFNRYAYANNNPMKFVDPDGRTPVHVNAFALGFATDLGAQVAVGLHGGKTLGEAFSGAFSAKGLQEAALSGVAAAVTGNVAHGLSGKALTGSISVERAVFNTAVTASLTNGAANVANSKLNDENNMTAAKKGAIGAIGGFAGGAVGGKIGTSGAAHLNGQRALGGIPGHIEATTRSGMVHGQTAARTGALGTAGQVAADGLTSTGSKAAEKAAE